MHSVSRSLLAAGIVALGGLTACGDKVEVSTQPTPVATKDSSVQSVSVTPSTAQIQVNGTQLFVANVVGGKDLVNRNVTWTSSNTTVATVDANGLATAKAAGQTTIIATSAANTAVKGAAVLTVNALAPASLSFFGVNNQFGAPATLNNANGQLNVIANVDPGQSGLTNVQLLLVCPKASGTGSDTTVVGSSAISGTTGQQTQQQVTIPFNTAAFNTTTGAATYKNGTCTLGLRGTNAAGATVISATGNQVTLNNTDFVAGTIAGARNATDQTGLRWDGGDVTVTVLPVFYSGVTPASLSVTINGTDTDGAGALALTATATQATGGAWTATFTEGTSAAPASATAIPNTFTIPALTATVNGVSSTGQQIVNPATGTPFAVNTTASAATGTPVAASIRYDNENPAAPTFAFATQNPNYTGTSGFINSAFAFPTTATAASGFGGLGAAGATCVATSNGTLCDHQGVDKVGETYSYTTSSDASIAAGTATWTAFTSVSNIPETASGSTYAVRITSCDALQNCTNLSNPGAQRFGVDVTAPTITNIAAPANNTASVTQNPAWTITAVDSASSAGVTGAGFGPTPVVASVKAVVPSGASGQTTVCVVQGAAGLTAAQSPTGVAIAQGGTYALPSTGCVSELLPFGFTLQTPLNGEYTVTYRVVDQAGNTTATGTRVYEWDNVNPAVSGGIAIPSSVTAGTSFTTSATDNVDVASGAGASQFTTLGYTFTQNANATPAGVVGDGSLTRSSTITYTPSPFYGQIQTLTAANTFSAADNLDNIVLRARDVTGNLSADQVTAVPAANVSTGTAFAANATPANGIQSFTVTPNPATVYNGTGTATTDPTATSLQAQINYGLNTGASPFSQVCFYYQSNGGANQNGALAGEWVLIGCQSAAAVTQNGALQRIFTYSISFDPASSLGQVSVPVIAVGNNGNAALVSATGTLNTNGM